MGCVVCSRQGAGIICPGCAAFLRVRGFEYLLICLQRGLYGDFDGPDGRRSHPTRLPPARLLVAFEELRTLV